MARVNSAATDMGVRESLLCADLHSIWNMPKIGITGSYDSSVLVFEETFILAAQVYIPNNSVKGFIFLPQPHQHLFLVFLMTPILMR
jgi:hypothetical protein